MNSIEKPNLTDNGSMTGSKNVLVAPEQIVFQEGSCIRRRTVLEKVLVVIIVVLLAVSIGLLIALLLKDKPEKVCLTDDCVKTAAMISEAIDYNVSPCDNFYDFACGNWRRKHIIPEDETSYGVINQLFQNVDISVKNALEKETNEAEPEAIKKAKTLYSTCMNTDLPIVQPLKAFLDKLGGWPVLNTSWTDSNFNLEQTMKMVTLYNSFTWDVLPLFTMTVTDDEKMSTRNIIQVDQPSFGMPTSGYYLKGRNDTMLKAYADLAVKIATLMGASKAEALTQMKDVVEFEIQLANISNTMEERRDANSKYNKMTIEEMHEKYSQFDWYGYLKSLFSVDLINISISKNTEIINSAPQYFTKLSTLLTTTDKRVVSNYLCWRVVMTFLKDLPSKYQEALNSYSKVVAGTSNSQPRWQKCVTYTKNLKWVTGRLFVDSSFNGDSKRNILDMITRLRKVFIEQIESSTWMDEQTKSVAKEKVNAIGLNVGYPNKIMNNEFLNNYYKDFSYSENQYFENKLETEYNLMIMLLKKLSKPVDKSEWVFSPAFVNANYAPTRNYIEFPAAILQPRFYSISYPSSVNYGGAGLMIGHEITHGFDDRGRQYDKNGNVKQWWTNHSISNFKQIAKCIIDQYSDFTVPEIGLKMNGVNTQGENIADSGGIKQAYKAYRMMIEERGEEELPLPGLNFTHNQILFISYAQNFCSNMRKEEAKQRIISEYHPPDRFRIIGALQNSEDFARVFQCSEDSYMNPSKKCSIW